MVKYIATKREGDVIVANFEEQKHMVVDMIIVIQ